MLAQITRVLGAVVLAVVAGLLISLTATLAFSAESVSPYKTFMAEAASAKADGYVAMMRFTARHGGERVDWKVVVLDRRDAHPISVLIVGDKKDADPNMRAEIHMSYPLLSNFREGDNVRVRGRFAVLTYPTGVLVTGERVTKCDGNCPCTE